MNKKSYDRVVMHIHLSLLYHEKGAKSAISVSILNELQDAAETVLTIKMPNKNCSRRHFNFLLLSFKENKA